MVRIMICAGTKDGAEAAHKKSHNILRAAKIRCELSFSTDPALIMNEQYIKTSSYDVYVLDACSGECLALAAHIRRDNATASILLRYEYRSRRRRCFAHRIDI